MPESVELGIEVCERLLRGGSVGRVAVSTPNGPHIVPLNYSVLDDSAYFRTSPYSVLGTYARNALLALEVDHVDYTLQESWSVVARGRCRFVEDNEEIQRLLATLPPRPWAVGTRNLFLAMAWSELSGRQLGLHWEPLAGSSIDRMSNPG